MNRADNTFTSNREINTPAQRKRLSNKEILEKISYVKYDDSRIPDANPRLLKKLFKITDQIPDIVFKIALWPDDTCGIVGYQKATSGLPDHKLIDLYHSAYETELTKRNDTSGSGGGA